MYSYNKYLFVPKGFEPSHGAHTAACFVMSRLIFEMHHEKKLYSGFPTRSCTNRAVQPEKMAKRDCTTYVAKTKAPKLRDNCAVIAQLICAFVFAYAKIRFSHKSGSFIWYEIQIVH